MIEQACKEHIPFIQRRLAPFKKVASKVIENIINSPTEIMFVDAEKEQTVRMSVLIRQKKIKLQWLLPIRDHSISMLPLLQACLIAVLDRFPKTAEWIVFGEFKAGRGCAIDIAKGQDEKIIKSWIPLFPGVAKVRQRWNGKWEISGTLKASARSDILMQPREVIYEPTVAYL